MLFKCKNSISIKNGCQIRIKCDSHYWYVNFRFLYEVIDIHIICINQFNRQILKKNDERNFDDNSSNSRSEKDRVTTEDLETRSLVARATGSEWRHLSFRDVGYELSQFDWRKIQIFDYKTIRWLCQFLRDQKITSRSRNKRGTKETKLNTSNQAILNVRVVDDFHREVFETLLQDFFKIARYQRSSIPKAMIVVCCIWINHIIGDHFEGWRTKTRMRIQISRIIHIIQYQSYLCMSERSERRNSMLFTTLNDTGPPLRN